MKTNIIFFDRVGSTREIWYHEVDLGRKLTKKKPITYDEISKIAQLRKDRANTESSWIVKIEDIKDYDLSAKNPHKVMSGITEEPSIIIARLEARSREIERLHGELSTMVRQ